MTVNSPPPPTHTHPYRVTLIVYKAFFRTQNVHWTTTFLLQGECSTTVPQPLPLFHLASFDRISLDDCPRLETWEENFWDRIGHFFGTKVSRQRNKNQSKKFVAKKSKKSQNWFFSRNKIFLVPQKIFGCWFSELEAKNFEVNKNVAIMTSSGSG